QRAIDLGYRYLETDAHATADGVVVAFHDRTLDRVTDRDGVISRLPWNEVAKARIAGTEPVPRLEDVLGSWPAARVHIDLKAAPGEAAWGSGPHARANTHGRAAPVTAPPAEPLPRPRAWNRVCIPSFSTRRLAQMRARLPLYTDQDVCMALGPRGVMALRAKS